MTRPILIAIMVGVLSHPVQAKGGGSDIQFEREKAQAEKAKAKKKTTTPTPSFFELIFGSGEKSSDSKK